MALTCCDIPAYLSSFPKTWREDLTTVFCELLAQGSTVSCQAVKDCETVTSLTELSLNGTNLSFTYFDERGTANFRQIDLSSIVGPEIDCNFVKSCETLTAVSALSLTGTTLSFSYTDEDGTVNNRAIDLSPILGDTYTLNTVTSDTITLSGDGNIATPLTAALKIQAGQPFSTNASGIALELENGLRIDASKLKLGGPLTEDTVFTANYKMFWDGPKLHIGPDTTTHTTNAAVTIIGDPSNTNDFLYVRDGSAGTTTHRTLFAIGRKQLTTGGAELPYIQLGYRGIDSPAAILINFESESSLYQDPIVYPFKVTEFLRNKALIFTGSGGGDVPFHITNHGGYIRNIDRFNNGVGANGPTGTGIRIHTQTDAPLLSTQETVHTRISSNCPDFTPNTLKAGRIVNTAFEMAGARNNQVNLNVTGTLGLYDTNELGNVAYTRNYTGLLFDAEWSRIDDGIGDPGYLNSACVNKDIHVKTKYTTGFDYTITGFHYDPDFSDLSGGVTIKETAIRTERGKIIFKNLPVYADNATALAALEEVGTVYRTATGELRIVY